LGAAFQAAARENSEKLKTKSNVPQMQTRCGLEGRVPIRILR